jgi:hypothetical protein
MEICLIIQQNLFVHYYGCVKKYLFFLPATAKATTTTRTTTIKITTKTKLTTITIKTKNTAICRKQ